MGAGDGSGGDGGVEMEGWRGRVEPGADEWSDGRVWGGGMHRVEEGGGGGGGGGDGTEGGGMCGRHAEPNRTEPHDTEVNHGKPKPDRAELQHP